jgi:transposase
VFLDESAALTDWVRTRARSPRGERAHGTAPCGRWARVTVLGAIALEGVVGAMSIEAAADGAVFRAYLDRVLLPELRRVKPDAVLVMDNLSAHKTPAVRELLDGSGFAYRYLPPCSPDLNPIEMAWAKVKGLLRQAAARTADTDSTPRSGRRSAPSPPGTPGASSATPATRVPTSPRFALGPVRV